MTRMFDGRTRRQETQSGGYDGNQYNVQRDEAYGPRARTREQIVEAGEPRVYRPNTAPMSSQRNGEEPTAMPKQECQRDDRARESRGEVSQNTDRRSDGAQECHYLDNMGTWVKNQEMHPNDMSIMHSKLRIIVECRYIKTVLFGVFVEGIVNIGVAKVYATGRFGRGHFFAITNTDQLGRGETITHYIEDVEKSFQN